MSKLACGSERARWRVDDRNSMRAQERERVRKGKRDRKREGDREWASERGGGGERKIEKKERDAVSNCNKLYDIIISFILYNPYFHFHALPNNPRIVRRKVTPSPFDKNGVCEPGISDVLHRQRITATSIGF